MAFRKRRQPTTVNYSTDQSDAPLAGLMAHVQSDEKPINGAPVRYLDRLAVLLVTDSRILWRYTEPDAPVLSLNFSDISEVKVDEARGVLLTYRPADIPDEPRSVDPRGELYAEFIFQPGHEDLREKVLGRAHREVELRAAGPRLASGVGYLEGVLTQEHYRVKVEARESVLVLFLGRLPMWICRYTAVAWFRVDPLPESLKASEHLGLGNTGLWLSIAGEGVEDRWRLVVKPDDVENWRVILEHFGIRDAAEGGE